jgi:hypothetical protein
LRRLLHELEDLGEDVESLINLDDRMKSNGHSSRSCRKCGSAPVSKSEDKQHENLKDAVDRKSRILKEEATWLREMTS